MELLKFLQENDLEGFKENLDMDSIEEIDEEKNTILHHCVEKGFKENLDMDSIEEIDEEKNTILHHCVEKGAYDFVDALVYNGADPNVKN